MPEIDEHGICRDEHGRWSGGCSVSNGNNGAPEQSSLVEKPQSEATKSAIAKQSAKYVGAEIQRYSEEHNEPILAHGVSGVSMPDNEPTDVTVFRNGVVAHGIELKTMVDNGNDKITMKASAMERKAGWMAEHNAPFHTVVFDDHAVFNANGKGEHDDSQRRILYRRGYGSFRTANMYACKDMAELNSLLDMPDDKLPEKAKPPKKYIPPSPKKA